MDQGLPDHTQLCVRESLAPLREIICSLLKVEKSACQFVIVPAYVMAGQAVVNVEIAILPKPERTRPMLSALAEKVQLLMANVIEGRIAVRLSILDPATYISSR